nr:Uma2 family endonuclease [Metasolibacillus meyeri]
MKEYWIISPDEKSIEVYLLKNGKYEWDNIYTVIPDDDLAEMTEEERAEIAFFFKVSIYDDFIIDIKEVFENVIAY